MKTRPKMIRLTPTEIDLFETLVDNLPKGLFLVWEQEKIMSIIMIEHDFLDLLEEINFLIKKEYTIAYIT